jgi:hypothetical protein
MLGHLPPAGIGDGLALVFVTLQEGTQTVTYAKSLNLTSEQVSYASSVGAQHCTTDSRRKGTLPNFMGSLL